MDCIKMLTLEHAEECYWKWVLTGKSENPDLPPFHEGLRNEFCMFPDAIMNALSDGCILLYVGLSSFLNSRGYVVGNFQNIHEMNFRTRKTIMKTIKKYLKELEEKELIKIVYKKENKKIDIEKILMIHLANRIPRMRKKYFGEQICLTP